ncbi:DMT family transporter [Fictibacillus barbaricus]|uniref:Transporter family-2 protein n=1 Tax=Fictibacillus barbaricus TaxID=182136 RepID=A0ABU1U282_9BACL|nr:DMT family transporter [Fictibacillus barbaricus]MDR7073583.1 transporter family-2 protein [Fictibacillus barbaricus]
MNWLMVLIVFMGGIAVSIQAGVNGGLGKQIGVIEGTFLSFLIGTVTLFIMMLIFGKGNLLNVSTVPKWQLIGGLLGAFYVYTLVLTVPKIGVASAIISVIVAQLITSSFIDHFGLLGMKQIPIDGQRILGFLFLIAALFLFTKR